MVRLSVNSPAGRELSERWQLRFTPTFVLFDGQGRPLLRGTALPDATQLAGLLTKT